MELAMEALKEIQLRFYRDFPPHEKEKVYGFATPSTMKPTQWSCKYKVLMTEEPSPNPPAPKELIKFIDYMPSMLNFLADLLLFRSRWGD